MCLAPPPFVILEKTNLLKSNISSQGNPKAHKILIMSNIKTSMWGLPHKDDFHVSSTRRRMDGSTS